MANDEDLVRGARLDGIDDRLGIVLFAFFYSGETDCSKMQNH
jgi:hypothetical protein